MSETWIIRENPSDIDILYITTEDARYGEEIAVIYSGNMEHAHLIKAAPKMRDALENLLIALSMGWDLEGVIGAAGEALAESRGDEE